jgi:hypothetical protein
MIAMPAADRLAEQRPNDGVVQPHAAQRHRARGRVELHDPAAEVVERLEPPR